MRVNELRIGNFVEQPNDGVTVVTAILNDLQIETETGYIDKYCIAIPLTQEWLERFGFEKIEMSIPTAYQTKDGFRVKVDERGYWMQYKHGMAVIKYAHQLQNLYFALTGQELTIK